MSIPPNIDRFNKTVLLIVDRLYLIYPSAIELDVTKIAMDTLPVDAAFDESFQSIEPVFHTIEILGKEGFIEYAEQTLDRRMFLEVRLTTKGLTLLGRTPSALEPQVSVSDKIRGVLKSGIKDASAEAAKKVVELLFTHGTSFISVGQSSGTAGP